MYKPTKTDVIQGDKLLNNLHKMSEQKRASVLESAIYGFLQKDYFPMDRAMWEMIPRYIAESEIYNPAYMARAISAEYEAHKGWAWL